MQIAMDGWLDRKINVHLVLQFSMTLEPGTFVVSVEHSRQVHTPSTFLRYHTSDINPARTRFNQSIAANPHTTNQKAARATHPGNLGTDSLLVFVYIPLGVHLGPATSNWMEDGDTPCDPATDGTGSCASGVQITSVSDGTLRT